MNRITRSIESAFSKYAVENVIEKYMTVAPPLHGIENLPAYDSTDWEKEGSVDYFINTFGINPRDPNPKLPYFSGRLGYRETEYTISAAQQALTAGSSLEWSLLTITHELVHGHVRNIINTIFCSEIEQLPEERKKILHERYMSLLNPPYKLENNKEIDSIRALIFSYCCMTPFTGSLTHKPKQIARNDALNGYAHDFRSVSQNKLWRLLRRENRNIHEIFSHIIDFHYFYGSCFQAYIPLIWRSWSAVPHVRADIRQYVLRSLLTIASTIHPNTKRYARFLKCIQLLNELLQKQEILGLNLIRDVNKYLREPQVNDLFPSFSNSLILVDLAYNIFVSENIIKELIADPRVDWDDIPTEFELGLKYEFSEVFSEEKVIKPTPYLISRVIKMLYTSELPDDLESKTARMMLACCSK